MLDNLSQLLPWSALLGGMVIGLAVTLLMRLNGKIAGISGVVGGLFKFKKGDVTWRIAFILGMLSAPLLWQYFSELPETHVEANYGMLLFAGLMVGFGTRYGSGCTSDHGVCGVSRLSPRSIIATLIFISMAIMTVYLIRHVFIT